MYYQCQQLQVNQPVKYKLTISKYIISGKDYQKNQQTLTLIQLLLLLKMGLFYWGLLVGILLCLILGIWGMLRYVRVRNMGRRIRWESKVRVRV